MAQNPVIEKLVKGAIDRCRERIASARRRTEGDTRNGQQAVEKSSITSHRKESHGL
jgi:hypothetical protein